MWSEKHPVFNCYQRAHQNTLETIPFFLTLELIGGLRHPFLAATCGGAFLIARIMYSLGQCCTQCSFLRQKYIDKEK